MSEYEFVAFQAVDGPLNDKQLAFAKRQSSRADVSRWSLSVEYHHSSFRGDVDGLLRQGFDVYLQHTNYGTREIKLRLPRGMPFAKSVWSKYVDGESLSWKKDAEGPGGIMTLCPYYESGDLGQVGEARPYLDAAIHVRDRLMTGDLRALYLLWLCAASDDNHDHEETVEPPVPHGIAEWESHGGEFLEFCGLDPLLLVAAGTNVEAALPHASLDQGIAQWVKELDDQRTKDILFQLLNGDTASEKARLLAEIRDSQTPDGWPTSDMQRSVDELLQTMEVLRGKEEAKEAREAQAKAKREVAKAERKRAERMREMRKDPNTWLREAERLVEARGRANCQAAAEVLHDLREAIGGAEGDQIARRHAAHLMTNHPTLTYLKSSLRKRGLLE